VNRSFRAAVVPALAALVCVLVVVDVVRQFERGVADPQLALFATSTCIAVVAALAVGRHRDGRRMAALILIWLAVSVLGDIGVMWPASRAAATVSGLAVALQPATYTLMIFAYPSGRLRDRLERAFVLVAFPVCLAWMAFPLPFADPSICPVCAPHVPSLLFVGTSVDLVAIGNAFSGILIGLGVLFIALVARRLHDAPAGSWRTLLPLAAAGGFAAANFVAQQAASLVGRSDVYDALGWIDTANTLVLPLAIFFGLATIDRRRGLSRRSGRGAQFDARGRGRPHTRPHTRRSLAHARAVAS
jgi:hypothetical protein